MAKVLYIKASPRSSRSHSVATADSFITEYRKYHPQDEIVTVDIFNEPLPDFNQAVVDAKYVILGGQQHSPGQKQLWKGIEQVIEKFMSADKYVIAVPMWNFSIPYRLKQYIDIIVQPGYTFSYSADTGYKGLVTGRPLLAVFSRGGSYSSKQAQALDMQKKYIEQIFGFMGFEDIRSLIVEPTLAEGTDVAAAVQAEAIAAAKQIAREF